MLFSSNVFLCVFLPSVLIIYLLIHVIFRKKEKTGRSVKNYFLLLASLAFYTYGGGRLVFLLIFVVLFNYTIARIMGDKPKKAQLAAAVIINLGLLVYFKYLGFLIEGVSAIKNLIVGGHIENPLDIILPIGISFYIFQAMSYTIDVYTGKVPVQKNPAKLALYISFFPQLIAGPIVRYDEVRHEIDSRKENSSDVYYGMCRFAMGLAKKVLIADTLGASVDRIFSMNASTLGAPLAWMGIFMYTLQIYFDFSGYSDMAIGMARIFGFRFRENFILPYTSKNITEFWTRWHVSLSSFLKDYLYIPLGGNRKGEGRTYVNLLIVFLLCGLWHGAAWTFVAWGVYHGILRMAERVLKEKAGFEMKGVWGQAITFVLVMFGWILFRSESFKYAFDFIGSMFGAGSGGALEYYSFTYYVDIKTIVAAAIGIVLAAVPFAKLRERLRGGALAGAAAVFCLVLSMIYLSGASFNPFIYFQF